MTEETLTLPRFSADTPGGCPRCSARVADLLRELDGVQDVTVLTDPMRISYQRDPSQRSRAEVEEATWQAVASIEQRYRHDSLSIEGMDCADCARKVERGVANLPGVEQASVNLMAARLDVEYDQETVELANISERVSSLGYAVATGTADEEEPEEPLPLRILKRRDNVLAAIAGTFAVAGGVALLANAPEVLSTALFLVGIVIGGVPLAIKGVRGLIAGRSIDINLLMTIAVIGAVVIGAWVEAAVVVVLFALSEALEGYAMERTRRSIRSLMQIAPRRALVVRDGVEVELDVDEVQPGDTVIVRPGQRIPLDGVVTQGESSADESPLTGESLPVAKVPGDALYAGTLNTHGVLQMQVTRIAADSSVARIIQLVEQAQSKRAPVQQLVDRFASYYTPAVVVFAAILATVPPLAFNANFEEWFYRALVILVIACPCALVISTPVSIVSALASAARRGILIKGGAALERASKIDTIAIDKTGTLTVGKPHVVSVAALNGLDEDQMLATAASLERHAEHPLAQAIVTAADERGIASPAASDVSTTPGAGLSGSVDQRKYRIGSVALFDGIELPDEAYATIAEIEQRGGTPVLLGTETDVLGVIGLADSIRRESTTVAAELHKLGIKRLVMLSGDRQAAADQIARQAGIDDARGQLLPGEKLTAIDDLRAEGHAVAMVGDGINDAPALAAADLGIAMGAAGSDTALETADIALMSDDLSGLARVVELARRARTIIAMNIGLALGIKAIIFALTLVGIASLWLAILADVGAALLVIANGLRLYEREAGSEAPAELQADPAY